MSETNEYTKVFRNCIFYLHSPRVIKIARGIEIFISLMYIILRLYSEMR